MAGGAVEEQGELVWEGPMGATHLRVDILPSGRLAARWRSQGGDRRVIVDTEQELERRVLFGLMVGRKKKRTRPSRRGIPRPRRR